MASQECHHRNGITGMGARVGALLYAGEALGTLLDAGVAALLDAGVPALLCEHAACARDCVSEPET